jgi:hypothetical protein
LVPPWRWGNYESISPLIRIQTRCYWPNFYYDVPAGSLDPDVAVGWRFEDYRHGVDTALERALRTK